MSSLMLYCPEEVFFRLSNMEFLLGFRCLFNLTSFAQVLSRISTVAVSVEISTVVISPFPFFSFFFTYVRRKFILFLFSANIKSSNQTHPRERSNSNLGGYFFSWSFLFHSGILRKGEGKLSKEFSGKLNHDFYFYEIGLLGKRLKKFKLETLLNLLCMT